MVMKSLPSIRTLPPEPVLMMSMRLYTVVSPTVTIPPYPCWPIWRILSLLGNWLM